jgi:hypothetical protein
MWSKLMGCPIYLTDDEKDDNTSKMSELSRWMEPQIWTQKSHAWNLCREKGVCRISLLFKKQISECKRD